MRCLDSVLRQTFEDFEVIVIDDGSTDGTSALCNAYSNKDTRIKVIRQTNQGANVSRSIGLKRSQGKYVLQIDADDWLEPNMLERMHAEAIANDADMVICDFAEHLSDKVIEYKQCPPQSLSSDVILRGIINGSVKGVVWNKLIRRSLFAQYNVVFPSNIIWLEDVYVNAQLLLHPLKISYVSQPLYHYDRECLSERVYDGEGKLIDRSYCCSRFSIYYPGVCDLPAYDRHPDETFRGRSAEQISL